MRTFGAIFKNLSFSLKSIPISVPRSGIIITVAKVSRCFVGMLNYTTLRTVSYKSLLCDFLKNSRLDEARSVFDKFASPDVYLCTMMVAGYAQNDRLDDALRLFYRIPVKDVVCWNSMIKGCLDCGDLSMACKVFDEMPERNVVSWTTMVSGFLQFGRVEMAERLFMVMPVRDVAAWNSMVYGYCCSGRVDDAMKLFEEMPSRNVISWTSMIGGLDQNGRSDEALILFRKMVSSGAEPTSSTCACVLTACANILALHQGVQIHGRVMKFGYFFDEYISASLITLYANCKKIENASKVFHERPHMNVVVWTALITGYGVNWEYEDALRAYNDMVNIGIFPNTSSLTSALNSCCGLECLEKGKEIHAAAIKLGLETDVFVGNSLIVMYSKCGNITEGVTVFKNTDVKNIISWNSVIVGCAQHGYGMWALTFFNQMIRAKVDQDEITFTGLLTACSHCGMLQKAKCLFKYFSKYKSVDVKVEHYACMVDILGRCGKLDEAEELVKNMPMKANSMVWLALLGTCRMHSNIEMAERAANCIFDLEPDCSAAYVLLSNVYASASRWKDVSRIRVKMKQKGITKQPGYSWVTLKGSRHKFLSGDQSHPSTEKIYRKLDWLGRKMKELGYIPDQKFALHDVEDEQKEEMLCYHSERLAIGFMLISTVEGSAITVMKNLRACGDCHSAIKLIAKIVDREIIVRDSSRFHHFKNGVCSCGDHW